MSSAPYELLKRHPQLLNHQTLTLTAEPRIPGDWLAASRLAGSRIHSWDWMTIQAAGLDTAHFGVPDASILEDIEQVILIWPKSKPLGLALINMIIGSGRTCFAVAANDAGGKSIGKNCKDIASAVRLDSARHCTLWQLKPPSEKTTADFNWIKQARAFQYADISLMTLPGVFSHGSLDIGTDVLLRHLPELKGDLLDIGCGSGVIGITRKLAIPSLNLTMVDTDAFALRSTALNCTRLGIEARILPSDGFSAIKGRFDHIISNPPFHTGKETDYRFAELLLNDCASHLKRNGHLWLVANRHLPYEEQAMSHFGKVEVVCQEAGFKIIHCSHPA